MFLALSRDGRAAPAPSTATTPPRRPPPKRWSSTEAGDPRRFRNRIDPEADLQAAAAVVLRGARRDRRGTGRTGAGGDAARAGRSPPRESGVEVPAFRATTSPAPARPRWRPWAQTPSWPPSSGASRPTRSHGLLSRALQRAARHHVSALLDGAVVPARRGAHIPGGSRERIPVPPRPQQRPAPVPGAGPLAGRRHRRRGLQGAAGGQFDNSERVPGVESQHAADVLNDRFPSQGGQSARIVLHTDDGRLDDAAHAATVDQARAQLAGGTDVAGVTDPFAAAVRRRQRRRADRLPRRHLRAGQAHRHAARTTPRPSPTPPAPAGCRSSSPVRSPSSHRRRRAAS